MDNISPGKLPLSLSIETACGLAFKIAEIGDPLPIKVAKAFSTAPAVPDVVGARLYAGERPFAADNILLAEMNIENVKGLFGNRPVISVVLAVDKELNIDIEVTDEGSLKTVRCYIDKSWVPEADEALLIVKEAQEKAAEDGIMKNRAQLIQTAREILCRPEFDVKALKEKTSFGQALKYRRRIKRLDSKLRRMKPKDLTEETEKHIIEEINTLNKVSGI